MSDESSLTLHDRHGDRMVFGPFGVRVGAEFFGWKALEDAPSLGLLCAISGAAVGSGMGRRTSLGTAMALTLANVRLGYWWPERRASGDAVAREKPAAPAGGPAWPAPDRPLAGLARLFPGLACLARELLGRFGTRDYWLLSDGGHAENTGALSLLERGCGCIIVCDNGEDPSFAFADLEIFIRTARTDIGLEVSVVAPDRFPDSLASVRGCFFNGEQGDWRRRVKGQDDEAFALLLEAFDIPPRADDEAEARGVRTALIIWLKPNRFANLPADLATYGELEPDFPQQSTGNQFFDEAQWESYRRLGFEMGRRLFPSRDVLAEFVPVIYRHRAPWPG